MKKSNKYLTLFALLFLGVINTSGFSTINKMQDVDINVLVLQRYYKGVEAGLNEKYQIAKNHLLFCKKLIPHHINSNLYLALILDYQNNIIPKKTIDKILYAMDVDRGMETDERLKGLDNIILDNPNYYLTFLFRADLLKKYLGFDESIKDYNKSITLKNNFAFTYYLRGLAFKKKGATRNALSDFRQSAELNQDFGPAFFEAGVIFNQLKDFDQAINYFKKAVIKWPVIKKRQIIYEVYNNRGTLRIKQKQFEKAIQDFDAAININDTWQAAFINKGTALRHLKLFNKALDYFDNALNNNPHNDEAYFQRGLTRMGLKEYDLAIKDLSLAATINPENNKFNYNLADCYFKNKQYTLAAEKFSLVTEKDPGYYWAYYWQAFSYEKTQKFKQAIQAYQKFVKYAPEKEYKHRLFATNRISRLNKWVNRK